MGNIKLAERSIRPAITYLIKNNCKKIILGCTELPIAIFAFRSLKNAKLSKLYLDPNLILANSSMLKYKK
jgi:aspartate racemase